MYLALQNIPRAFVLTLGNKVILNIVFVFLYCILCIVLYIGVGSVTVDIAVVRSVTADMAGVI